MVCDYGLKCDIVILLMRKSNHITRLCLVLLHPIIVLILLNLDLTFGERLDLPDSNVVVLTCASDIPDLVCGG